MREWLNKSIIDPRTYGGIVYLLLALPLGIAEFTFLVTALALVAIILAIAATLTLTPATIMLGMLTIAAVASAARARSSPATVSASSSSMRASRSALRAAVVSTRGPFPMRAAVHYYRLNAGGGGWSEYRQGGLGDQEGLDFRVALASPEFTAVGSGVPTRSRFRCSSRAMRRNRSMSSAL